MSVTRAKWELWRAGFTVLLAVCHIAVGLRTTSIAQSPQAKRTPHDSSRLALPASGELQVENRRGDVVIETWSEEAVSLAVSFERPPQKRSVSPVKIDNSEKLVRIAVAPNATQSRVDLMLRVPTRAKLKVNTAHGKIDVRSPLAQLVAQTISGDITVSLAKPLDANVTAQSLNGSVTVAEGFDEQSARPQSLRGKFQTSWNSGSYTVNLFSGRGRIQLVPYSQSARQAPTDVARPPHVDVSPARAKAGPSVTPTPEAPQEVDEGEVVRVDADLVTVNASVVDRASGQGLKSLAKGDFILYEDNVQQEITQFEASNAPFDLLLLIDLSGSTAKVSEIIRGAAKRFVAATRPQDRIAVVAFTADTAIVSPLSSDHRALQEAIDRMAPPNGDTRIYDSLAKAITYFEREAAGSRRRAIVLMSDGLDSSLPNVDGDGSTLTYSDVRDRVREFDGLLYAIWTSTEYEAFSPEDIQPETFDLAGTRMEEFAEAGGGAFYSVERMEDLAGAYERVVADLGTIYSLSYRPTNRVRDGSWRAIRLRLPRHGNAVARGKRGYYAK
jgi:VWFA-related protein